MRSDFFMEMEACDVNFLIMEDYIFMVKREFDGSGGLVWIFENRRKMEDR